ncbi:MAG: phage/plasmid primase, P4 family, C-terminal domain-containing protein [Candidatus Nitrotoga sp. SPKER]|nr:MAG: phage/plasmid primase, P4 family, C-terminal domain-containing protein [Candidatus Nitrotoga sp. SPKER]
MTLATDMNQAQRFLTLLAGDEPLTFQTFDDGATKNPKLARILHGNLEEHAAALSVLNAQGAGIFVMVNCGDGLGRKAANVTDIRALFVDLDGAPLEPILAAGVEPHITIESSADRYHAYWLVSDCALEQFTPLQAALAAKFNSDPKVKDLPRVMRLPGFWHQKAEPIQTRIIEEKSHAPYAVAELMERLELNTKPTAKSIDDTPVQTLNFDRKNAIAGFAQGNRDDGLFRYACSLRGRGLDKKEAQLLVLAAAANCQPLMPELDANKCLESAWHYDSARTERLTDVGNAKRLVSLHGRDLRYVPEFKKWLVWDVGRWLIDEDGEIMRRAKITAAAVYVEAKSASEAGEQPMADKLASHAGKSQSVQRLKAMIELAQTEPGIPARTTELDNNNYLLGVANGVINLETGALREPRREDLITKRALVAYEPDAKAPMFLAFLDRIMGGNQALVGFIQRAVGYSLTGITDEQCLFFLHGSGQNGKSTLLTVIKELLGDYAMQCPAETLMAKQGGGIPNDIARLRGARMVATSETEDGRRFAEAMLKQLTGQDTIAARFLFAEYFEFIPNFKIWLAANHKPVIRGDDFAIWRRIRLIPFAVTIPPEEKDGKLPEKLRAEYPGILAWALQGCLEWQRQGLNPPPEVLAATEEYKSEMDLIGKWIEECCITASHATAKASALYGNYKRWVEDNGGFALSSTKFGMKLGDRGYQKEKSGTVVYHGIGLADTTDSLDSFSVSTS